jgi:hypothetical protein
MQRHYFISENLDEVAKVERELDAAGLPTEQIHVLSNDDGGCEERHMHDVQSLMKKDVVRKLEWGALAGVVAAGLALALPHAFGLTRTVGWIPFVFLAIVLLGFATWEGGFFGIKTPNSRFRRFERALADGKHVLFVDVEPGQEPALAAVQSRHPDLTDAGTGTSSPRWIVAAQRGMKRFVQWAP